ncbi:aminoglycoside phosphotransferase family protein [Ktedonospora formicarum]|uniref:Aminoglycoside phosphotransferase domain-containing protein n=1 Tax=Ktedonospora formicarum TaxID=2778364 RepID=A0A8J3MRB9_9CHLR|nr:aminoglycoside phosphotransferase family protein [Ktedonospora formicarum]GHO44890.1 hypothetical protein KSX_30530 [Ktedonospora formicarum]
MLTISEAENIIKTINACHHLDARLRERCQGGEQGAFYVEGEDGSNYILKHTSPDKVEMLQQIGRVIACLYELGYPAPRYACVGATEALAYSLQEALPGIPLEALRQREQLERLLKLNTLQRGQASGLCLPCNWPTPVVETVLVGGDGFCILDTLRQHSTASVELLARCQEIVRTHADAVENRADIVHLDFHFHNILVHDDEISGVIDWDGCLGGDATFDLVTLLFYSYSNHLMYGDDGGYVQELWLIAREESGLSALRVYLAHMLVRQVEWSLRLHERSVAEHWLRVARMVLRDLHAGIPLA